MQTDLMLLKIMADILHRLERSTVAISLIRTNIEDEILNVTDEILRGVWADEKM